MLHSGVVFSLHKIKRLSSQNVFSLECRGCCALRAVIILLILTSCLSLEQPVSAIIKVSTAGFIDPPELECLSVSVPQ